MTKMFRLLAFAFIASSLAAFPARAAEIKIFAGGAMTGPIRTIAEDFARTRGLIPIIVSDTTGALQRRLRMGEKADVVVVTAQGIDALQMEKLVVGEGRGDLARALIGVAVRKGAPPPDISSTDAFKRALLAARSVSYVDPAAGGTSGTYIVGLLQRFGMAEAIRAKTVYRQQGAEVAAAVAAGEAEIGITFTSELAPNAGVAVVGPLPDEIQSPTIYTAAMTAQPVNAEAAKAFLAALHANLARDAVAKSGMEPLIGR